MRTLVVAMLALCTIAPLALAAPDAGGEPVCVDALYDLTTDAGARACVDPRGECVVGVDSKFLWLPGSYCLLS